MAANVLSFLLQADVISIRHGTTPLQHNYFFHKKTGRSAWTMEVPKSRCQRENSSVKIGEIALVFDPQERATEYWTQSGTKPYETNI